MSHIKSRPHGGVREPADVPSGDPANNAPVDRPYHAEDEVGADVEYPVENTMDAPGIFEDKEQESRQIAHSIDVDRLAFHGEVLRVYGPRRGRNRK